MLSRQALTEDEVQRLAAACELHALAPGDVVGGSDCAGGVLAVVAAGACAAAAPQGVAPGCARLCESAVRAGSFHLKRIVYRQKPAGHTQHSQPWGACAHINHHRMCWIWSRIWCLPRQVARLDGPVLRAGGAVGQDALAAAEPQHARARLVALEAGTQARCQPHALVCARLVHGQTRCCA